MHIRKPGILQPIYLSVLLALMLLGGWPIWFAAPAAGITGFYWGRYVRLRRCYLSNIGEAMYYAGLRSSILSTVRDFTGNSDLPQDGNDPSGHFNFTLFPVFGITVVTEYIFGLGEEDEIVRYVFSPVSNLVKVKSDLTGKECYASSDDLIALHDRMRHPYEIA